MSQGTPLNDTDLSCFAPAGPERKPRLTLSGEEVMKTHALGEQSASRALNHNGQ